MPYSYDYFHPTIVSPFVFNLHSHLIASSFVQTLDLHIDDRF
jgi:hypothetical protein